MTDDELRSMLRSWQAPRAPESLRRRLFPARPFSLGWLLTGELRIPVPVALAAMCLLLAGAYVSLRRPQASLSDFDHVTSLRPRIVRTSNANP